jgi:hypothetical protein
VLQCGDRVGSTWPVSMRFETLIGHDPSSSDHKLDISPFLKAGLLEEIDRVSPVLIILIRKSR